LEIFKKGKPNSGLDNKELDADALNDVVKSSRVLLG
jgi:hypothetical protein